MYPRKRCSTKGPVASRETNVSLCFNRGRAVGYKAGIEKGAQDAMQAMASRAAVQRQLAARRPRQEAPRSIGGLTLRALGDLARENGIRGYSSMRKDQVIAALLALVRPGRPGERLYVL
jgi:hypothetical protein